jgi:hypothetical protein
MVIDMIEAALDVALDDPLVRPPLAAASRKSFDQR